MNSTFLQILVNHNDFVVLMGIYTCVDMGVSVMGVITNSINTRTFVAMGADDGVTMSFLFLSASDFICCLAALGQKISMLFWVTEMATDYKIWFSIDPYVINAFFGNIRACLFEIPILITTYLSLAKCMCVVKPLSFKSMFTVSRTRWIMAGISMFSIFSYIPIFATMATTEKLDVNINITRHVIWFSSNRDFVKTVVVISRDFLSAIGSEVIVAICLVLMAQMLSKSIRFRERLKSGTFSGKLDEHNSSFKVDSSTPTKLSGKELQIIRQVALIAVVFIAGNTPKVAVFLVIFLVPDFTPLGRYQNLYDVIIKGRELCELMTSSVNIFIYFKFNSKFRRYCRVTC